MTQNIPNDMGKPAAKRARATRIKRQPRGRPQGDAVQRVILKAANDLLEEKGFAGFTIEAVAERSRASRSTIYRWWPSRGALAMAGFLAETGPQIAYATTKSPIADLKEQMRLVAAVYAGKVGRTISAIVAQAQGDAQTAKALLDGYVSPRREEAKRVLERAVSCGELRADVDLDVAVDALYGPIWYRMLVPHRPLSQEWIVTLADHVIAGLRPR